MMSVDECIFGNSVLHDRFIATTEILARLVSSAPRAVRLEQLEEATGRAPAELVKLCAGLERAGLLQTGQDSERKWSLICDASQVTLEDVFRCVLYEQSPNEGSPRAKAARAPVQDRQSSDVNLFVMQAMITINQSVFKHLRQFSLDRLKISAAGMLPAPRRSFGAASLDDAYDMAISGRKASNGSPMRIPA